MNLLNLGAALSETNATAVFSCNLTELVFQMICLLLSLLGTQKKTKAIPALAVSFE